MPPLLVWALLVGALIAVPILITAFVEATERHIDDRKPGYAKGVTPTERNPNDRRP
jgi:hypothetical protein